jgi:hypothetical protein
MEMSDHPHSALRKLGKAMSRSVDAALERNATLIRAAEIIEGCADELCASFMVPGTEPPEWLESDTEIEAEHDEMIEVASKLREMARIFDKHFSA